MLIPQLYLNGSCSEAIERYKEAFKAEVDSILYDEEKKPEKFVIHAEMHIHEQRVMLSDWGGNKNLSPDSAIQLVITYTSKDELKKTYSILKEGSQTIIDMGPTFYSTCLVDFVDKYGVRWCLMI